MTRAATIAMLALLATASCKDETPPHFENVCVKEEFSYFITTFVQSGNAMIPIMTPVYECVETEVQCVYGDDYTGDKSCGV